MPYISIGNRMALDPIIDGLVKRLGAIECRPGDLNYVVTRLVLETLNHDDYHSLSDCVRVLRDAADEIQRRLLGPYEDGAIKRNGDLQAFQRPYAYKPEQPGMDDWQGCHTRRPAGHECCYDPQQTGGEDEATQAD